MAAGSALPAADVTRRQLVVLAGGRGTRLAGALGEDLPKPMAPVAGRPVLEHQLRLAKSHGFEDVLLLVHHRAAAIEEHFGDGSDLGLRIRYRAEERPLGTAGAVLDALEQLEERFTLLYGDTLLDVDLDLMWRVHAEAAADATLFVHPNDHPHDSDLVEVDDGQWVRAFHPHPHPEGAFLQNLVNAALYVIERRALEAWAPARSSLDFAHDLFPRMLEAGARLRAHHTREYIKDMGTPERLARVERDLRRGLVSRLALRNECPAVFLDRDGTLNVEKDRISDPADLELVEGAAPAVRRLNREGLLAVVITNQPVIARGDCDEAVLAEIHRKLETLLGRDGAYLDALYYCPHHPDRGFPGERPELKVACDCRKPGTASFERAIADLRIDRGGSWMVGDSTVDLQAARNAGLRSVLVRTGHAGHDRRFRVRPDYECFDLLDAVDFITLGHPAALSLARSRLPDCAPGALVAIGGLGRSGKSAWATVLREVLLERGQRAVIVPLDSWLRSLSERAPGHVLERFDVPAIESAVARLAGRSEPISLRLGHYDRRSRERDPEGETLRIEPGDVVLFEGVPALAIDALRRVASPTFYVECPEPLRRERFQREYRMRGRSDAEIEALYRERDRDEHPFIEASGEGADVRVCPAATRGPKA